MRNYKGIFKLATGFTPGQTMAGGWYALGLVGLFGGLAPLAEASNRTEELRMAARQYYEQIKPGMTPEQIVEIRRNTLDKAYQKSSNELAEQMQKGLGMTPDQAPGSSGPQTPGNLVGAPGPGSSPSPSAASNTIDAPGTVFVPLVTEKKGINAPFRSAGSEVPAVPAINRPSVRTPPKR